MIVFGSKVYVHVPKELKTKWNNKAKELRLMCIADNAKDFRLLDPNTDKISISKDVK